jgi:hypothetical protein
VRYLLRGEWVLGQVFIATVQIGFDLDPKLELMCRRKLGFQ